MSHGVGRGSGAHPRHQPGRRIRSRKGRIPADSPLGQKAACSKGRFGKAADVRLNELRLTGNGPVYSKAGPKIVVYRIEDLEVWLDANRRRSTSDTADEGAE